MKQIFKLLALAAVGAALLGSCQKDKPEISGTDPADTTATGGGSCEAPTNGATMLNETMLTQPSFNTFTAQNVSGDQVWGSRSTYGATMSGYANSVSNANEDWLISPVLDLSAATFAVLTFDHARGPANSMSISTDNFTLWVSVNYTDGAPATATWTQLTIPAHGTKAWEYAPSGNICLPLGFSNTRFAFKYLCTDSESATWEVKNVLVLGDGIPTSGSDDGGEDDGGEDDGGGDEPIVTGDNLLANPSFEDYTGELPTGWAKYVANSATGTFTKVSADAQDGSNAVKIASSGGASALEQVVPVEAGATYVVSFYYKNNTKGQDSQGMRIWSSWMSSPTSALAGGEQPAGLQPGSTLAVATEWTRYSAEVTAPAAATHLRFAVRATNGYEGIIDNCSLVKK
jgi:hypothetical protein